MGSQIVQYILVRKDLISELNWPLGAIIAQACHACTAVNYLFENDEATRAYLQDLDRMHKVVLEVPNREELSSLANKLQENNVLHKLWVEQPENFPTCIAVKPYEKDHVQKYFKKYKLLKGL